MVPFVVAEHLEEVGLEHPRRWHEQPVRGIYQLQVVLLADVPDLGHQRFVGLNQSLDFFLKGAHDH